jgi:hypothetical protein
MLDLSAGVRGRSAALLLALLLASQDACCGRSSSWRIGAPFPRSSPEARLAWSVVLLVVAIAMGALAIWDIGRLATTMRARLEAMPMAGASYRRLPSWTFRAFGVWCFVFGIGQLVFVYITVHGASH